jgi:hypothetical protein
MSNYDSYQPDRVNSGGYVQPQQVPVAQTGAQPQQVAHGAVRYGNGRKGKKGSGVNKAAYHDRKTDAPMFLQSEFQSLNRIKMSILFLEIQMLYIRTCVV